MAKEKVPVVIRGVHYGSLAEAAKAHNLTSSCIYYHLEAGTLDQVGTGRDTRSKPVTIAGITYPSILSAARSLRKGRDTIKKIVAASK